MSGPRRAYRKVARAHAEEHTRTELLDAADQAFMSGPWEHASLEAIAGAAGELVEDRNERVQVPAGGRGVGQDLHLAPPSSRSMVRISVARTSLLGRLRS